MDDVQEAVKRIESAARSVDQLSRVHAKCVPVRAGFLRRKTGEMDHSELCNLSNAMTHALGMLAMGVDEGRSDTIRWGMLDLEHLVNRVRTQIETG